MFETILMHGDCQFSILPLIRGEGTVFI